MLAADLSANAALFHALTPAEINSIFRDEPIGPPECSICAQPSDQWITFCDNGHSFCVDCVTHTVNSDNPDCPQCREPVMYNSRGQFHRNLAANNAHNAYIHENPNWEARIRDFAAPCPNAGTNGDGCLFTGTRVEMKQHVEKECPFQQVKCPKTKFGCTHVGRRSEIQLHLERFDHTKYAFNLMEAMAEEAKKREDALYERIGRLEGVLERTTTALANQQSTIDLLATNVGEFRDRQASTTSALDSVRSAVDIGNTHSRTFIDRLFRPGRNGVQVAVGSGSRPGGSSSQRREHRLRDQRRIENQQLHAELDRRDRRVEGTIAVGRAEPVRAAAVSQVAAVPAASSALWRHTALASGSAEVHNVDSGSDSSDDENEIPLRARNVRARHGSAPSASSAPLEQ
jgi:hypothetical protein